MTRFEFLKTSGFTGGALVALLASCVNKEDTYIEALVQNPDGSTSASTVSGSQTGSTSSTTGTTTPTTTTPTTSSTTGIDSSTLISTESLSSIKNTLLVLDLSSATYANLKNRNAYVIASNIVVALNKSGKLVAATVTCTHEPKKQVIFSNEEWYCTAHSARFSQAGVGLNSKGSKGLTVYKVATDGNKVVVY
jgi:nitrite reductase/ring-hydroxylating ferredoxin subunit